MKAIKITDIVRKDVPLYYRNKYSAFAELELSEGSIKKVKIEFAVEVTPISGKEYSIDELETIDYPTLPVKNVLIEMVKEYDREGLLP